MSSGQVRQEEQIAADLLKSLLKSRYGLESTWVGVAKDPPDVRFDVVLPTATESWAVEVTGLFAYVDSGDKSVNRMSFEPAIYKMVERLNRTLEGDMRMGYWLHVQGPLDPSVFRQLESRMRAYILSGNNSEEPLDLPENESYARSILPDIAADDPAVRHIVSERTRVTIKGTIEHKGVVVMSMLHGRNPGSDRPVADIDATLQHSIAKLLEAKLPRMATVDGYDRKVLLIWDGYFLGDPPSIARHVNCSKQASPYPLTLFDGIFFAQFGRNEITLIRDYGLNLRPTR